MGTFFGEEDSISSLLIIEYCFEFAFFFRKKKVLVFSVWPMRSQIPSFISPFVSVSSGWTPFVLSGGYECLYNLQHCHVVGNYPVDRNVLARETSGGETLLIPDGNLNKHSWWCKRAPVEQNRASRLFSDQSLKESLVKPVDASSYSYLIFKQKEIGTSLSSCHDKDGRGTEGNMVSQWFLSPLRSRISLLSPRGNLLYWQ